MVLILNGNSRFQHLQIKCFQSLVAGCFKFEKKMYSKAKKLFIQVLNNYFNFKRLFLFVK